MNAERLLQHYEQIADAPDAIARLRRFILDLAARGKLVPQDSGDEPASELLKRIAAEKAGLVQAGELREAREYDLTSGVERSTPLGWSLVPLGQILKRHLGGGTPSKNDSRYWGGDILWASVKDVGKTKYIESTVDRITDEGLARSSSNLIPPGNLIVVTRMGLGQLSINRVPVAINQDLRALFLSSFLNIDFVYNFFLTHQIDGTGLTVKGIKLGELLAIPFPLPPLAEQHRIVAKVDELMALCDELDAMRTERETKRDRLAAASLARLNTPDPGTFRDDARFALDALPALTARPDQIKQLRQTILNLAVCGKLVLQDPADEPAEELLKRIVVEKARLLRLGEIKRDKVPSEMSLDNVPFSLPISWRWCRLRSLASALGDGLHGTPSYVLGTEYYFINGNNLEDGHIVIKPTTKTVSAEEVQKHRKPLNKYSVLVSINGTLGKVAFYEGQKIVLGKSACYFNLTALTNKWFAKLVLDSPYFKEYAEREATGTTIKNLSLNAMNELPIPLPPLAEQHRIVAKVDELMALCDQLETSLTGVDETRKKLLDALLAEALAPVDAEVLQQAAE